MFENPSSQYLSLDATLHAMQFISQLLSESERKEKLLQSLLSKQSSSNAEEISEELLSSLVRDWAEGSTIDRDLFEIDINSALASADR